MSRRLFGPLSAALLLLCACARGPRVVELAVAVPLTGDMGTEGRGVQRAVELAVEQANAARRFPFRLEVLPFDDRNDPREAVSVANLIATDPRVAAVVGHYTSGCALAAAPVYARSGIPMLTPSATNPDLTRAQLSGDWPGPRVVFRLVADDEAQGRVAARFMHGRLRRRRVAVIDDGTAYGAGLAASFAQAFKRRGGRVAVSLTIEPGQRDLSKTAAKIGGADGVFFGGVYTDAGVLLKALRGAGMKQPFVSGDGARTEELIDVAGDAADGAYATMVAAPVEKLPQARAFVDAYAKRYAADTEGRKPFDHLAYEAAQLVFAAMEKAGGADRAKVLKALAATRRAGLLGPEAFDEKGDLRDTTVTMTRVRVKDRAFVAVE